MDYSLYLVTDPVMAGSDDRLCEIVTQAVAGGVTVVQLRDKLAPDAALLALGRRLQGLLDIPLFINDRVAVAAELGCHLHVGQGDTSVVEARAQLGEGQLIGLSVGSQAELDAVPDAGPGRPDLLGIGPVFSTTTKADAPAGLGVEESARLAAAAAARGLDTVGIGGIDATRAALLRNTAFSGICVVSAIMAADDPRAAAQQLKEAYRG